MKYLLTGLLLLLTSFTIGQQEEVVIPTVILPPVEVTPPTPNEEIFNAALSSGLDSTMAKLLVAQAIHETGGFKSRLYRRGNNAFGMMVSKKDTLKVGSMAAEGRPGYAKYESLEESTKAVIGLLTRKGCSFKFKSPHQYASWLKSVRYYEDSVSNYSNALNVHYKKVVI
jgi:hypothetical protein